MKAAGRHSLPEELLELLLAEPETKRLQATNTVLNPLFIIRTQARTQELPSTNGEALVIIN